MTTFLPFPETQTTPGGGLTFSTPLVIQARKLDTPAAPLPEIVGGGGGFTALMGEVRKVAPFDMAVVLLGETGTGKTTIAKAIHDLSPRARGPFVELNCSTIPADLVESELFGHEKHAFTGAAALKKGLMEVADGGTLFLDEIGDMPAAMQVKLLTALETTAFRRVGGDKQIRSDFRIISATNRDLDQLVASGQFRQDLRARLGSFRLRVLPLRERPEDVPALLGHYLAHFAPRFGRFAGYTVEPAALEVMVSCAWPDNVRQLRSVAERLAFDAMDSGLITAADALRVADSLGARASDSSAALAPLAPLPPSPPSDAPQVSIPPYVVGEPFERYEARVLVALAASLLQQTGHHKKVAEALGLSPRALYKRLQRAKTIAA